MLRLTLARRGPLALRTSRRTLCAESPAMLDQVKSAVADMKEKAEAKTSSGYETLKADIEAGTVDTAKLGAALSFSDDAKKLGMQCVSEINKDRMSSGAKEVDFGMWEGKLSAEVVAKIKGVYDTSMADLESGDTYKLMTAEHDTAKDTIASAFKDLLSEAKKAEAESNAGITQCIADLELLEKQMQGISEQTIAQILEQEPEMRKEIEEEIANHNWGA